MVPFVLAALARGDGAVSPIQAGISRQIETRADVDALVATRDPGRFVEMLRTLALRSTRIPPTGVVTVVVGSHPTMLERVALASARLSGQTLGGLRTNRPSTACPKSSHSYDDDRRDERDHQGVLDGGGATFVFGLFLSYMARSAFLEVSEMEGRRRECGRRPTPRSRGGRVASHVAEQAVEVRAERVTAAMMTAAMRATIRPYSTAVAPFSSSRRALSMMVRNWIMVITPGS